MTHRLDPLLRPRSVAVVGASASKDSLGEWSLKNLKIGGFKGDIYPVNPRYDEILELQCYPSLLAVPETPDLVIFAIRDERLELALDQAIESGVSAAVIMSALAVDDDAGFAKRIRNKIHDCGMLVCGPNGMGFYNVRDHVWACGFDSAPHAAPGNASLISHSGAGMSGIIDCEERLRINVAVSTGREISVSMDEYLDFVLDLPETKVVGLFIETARNPEALRRALEKACYRKIPIVALKVGRTEEAASLAVSHSGLMAGDDAAYAALFDFYGVQRVRDMDELTTTMILFAELNPVGEGGLVTLHDSGGERQLLVDLADEAQVPLTKLTSGTIAALEAVLDPELPAVNPLDGWSRGGPNSAEQMARCLSILMQDPGAALAATIHDRAPGGRIYPSYLNYMQRAHAETGKPVALVAARQGTGDDHAAVTSTHAGFPVLDGVSTFLRGVKALFDYRDYGLRKEEPIRSVDADVVKRWAARLSSGDTLAEAESIQLLADFGMNVVNTYAVAGEAAAINVSAKTGFPLVMKSAKPNLLHKSDEQGVVLNIKTERELCVAYADLRARLGKEVVLGPMIENGIEMFLGARRDPQFGPVVLIGFGGIHAETLADLTFALPPFDAPFVERCLDRLRLTPLLKGTRGAIAVDVQGFCKAASIFSSIVAALRDVIVEVDINPIIVSADGAIAVDALFVGHATYPD